ncbi:MAG: M28 family metallopeptidase [Candidatus Thermoplasmatota archaeon]|jgi:hypothetical protein|nr:M28 family metallopeptidase [Candidatus Thermoplasmatota archaeon]
MDRRVVLASAAAVMVVIVVAAIALNAGTILGGDRDYVLIGFDVRMARTDVETLISNGPRMTGSQSEYEACSYIASQFKEAGLVDVNIEKYDHMLFSVNEVSVSIIEYGPMMRLPKVGGEQKEFRHIEDYVIQGFSGSTTWNNFRDDLEIVNVGDGNDAAAFSAASGRAAFVEQTAESPHNNDLFDIAYQSGAEALVLQNLFQGEEVGYLPFFKSTMAPEPGQDYPDIPFFMVSKDVGNEMLSKTMTHKLRLDINVQIGMKSLNVVVGDIKGSKEPDRMVVLGAHHDTCYNTVGVVDNTVGVASVLGMARSLAGYRPERTIRFLTFGGEEEGLYGSIMYYLANEAELDRCVDLYMNFDMPHADREALRVTMTTTANSSIPVLNSLKSQLLDREPELRKYSISIVQDDMYWAGSDHWPFVEAGHPAMGGWGSGSAEYHTYKDDITQLNEESLQICGRIIGSYALYAAT